MFALWRRDDLQAREEMYVRPGRLEAVSGSNKLLFYQQWNGTVQYRKNIGKKRVGSNEKELNRLRSNFAFKDPLFSAICCWHILCKANFYHVRLTSEHSERTPGLNSLKYFSLTLCLFIKNKWIINMKQLIDFRFPLLLTRKISRAILLCTGSI